MRLRRGDAALVVVDVQEAFRKAVPDFEELARRASILLEGARILGIPAVVTEQYPRGLGSTAPEVGLDGEPVLEKTVFAASRADGFDLRGRVLLTIAAGSVAYRQRAFALSAA